MSLVYTIIIGLIVGFVARFLMPGRDPAGFIVTTLLGVVGAVVASFIGRLMGFYNDGEPAGFLMSVVGALLVLFAYNKFAKKDGSVSNI